MTTLPVVWAKVIDERRCIGCHACTIACKAEHQVPLGVTRTFVKQVEIGVFPSLERNFQVTRCNQCEEPPCTEICPTGAMFQRDDGIVDFNRATCIGCKACIAACPYDAIYIDPETHSAEKCNFCSHRIDEGMEPACVSVCPTQAIVVGDRNDAESPLSRLLAENEVSVRRPEKGTRPKLFYVQGQSQGLDPLAAASRVTFAAAQRPEWARPTPSSASPPAENQAAGLISYGNNTRAPWDWRVSGYSWAKAVGGGAFAVAAMLALLVDGGDRAWDVAAIATSAAFMALAGALLIGDLSHPARFYTIFLRPRWESWLVRGAFLIASFSLLLAAALAAALAEAGGLLDVLRGAGAVLAMATVVYTAFLFRQSKGRDMWQDAFLPWHTLVKGVAGGAGALAVLTLASDLQGDPLRALQLALGSSAALHVVMTVARELAPRRSAAARVAAHNMTRGPWALHFWGGLAATAVAVPLAMFDSTFAAGGVLALAGLLAQEHAFVQAGQSDPLT
jgi:Fe-S-cluster-containing dehydrogenase component/formate-dependent nitrite reductase membrane component NrfD